MEQNGPGLEYRVAWKPQGAPVEWEEETVTNHTLRVMTPTVYAPYEVQVQAVNRLGPGPEPQSVVLYSGEDCECLTQPPATRVASLSRWHCCPRAVWAAPACRAHVLATGPAKKCHPGL